MLEAFEMVAPTGKRISLHAETNSIMERRETRLREAGRIDPLAHLAARPAVVAVEAVSRAAILAEWTGARIHILHISSAEELRPLREAKARGVDITGETCPQYLMLSSDDYARLGGVIRVNPPVREARNQEPLWRALADGTIDIIATDHAPHAPEEKTRNDIWTVDCGFPGVETQMPLMLTEVARRAHEHLRLRALERRQAGADLGPLSAQGRDPAGSDADLAVVDLDRELDHRRRQAAVALQDHAVARAAGAAACRCTRWCAAASSCATARSSPTRAAGAARSTPSSACRTRRRATPTRPCAPSWAAPARRSEQAA